MYGLPTITEAGTILGPDASLAYLTNARRLRFSRGVWPKTEDRALAVKLRTYTHNTCSREWATELSRLPGLLVVTPDLGQEQRIHHLARICAGAGLLIRTTT